MSCVSLVFGCCSVMLVSALAPAQEQSLTPPPPQASPVVPEPPSQVTPEQSEQPLPDATSRADSQPPMPQGDAARGRLVFGPCRTCHYFEPVIGHNNGPSLHRIFGKVAGKQEGFAYYSEDFKVAQFVWTPELMYAWLENPMAMFPGSTMMSLGVPDSQQRADLIEFLKQATVREP